MPKSMVAESGPARPSSREAHGDRSWAQRTASLDMSLDAAAAAGMLTTDRTPLAKKTLSFGGAPPSASPPDRTGVQPRARATAAAFLLRVGMCGL